MLRIQKNCTRSPKLHALTNFWPKMHLCLTNKKRKQFSTLLCSFHVSQEIARKYPDVPLSTVLIAEKKFVEADLDRNGVRQVCICWK